MSMRGKKNRQNRMKESVDVCLNHGARTLASLIGSEHLRHKELNKKKNNPGGLLNK
jgi:hypothetical protein